MLNYSLKMLKFALIATTSSRGHALGGIRLRTMPTSSAIYSTTTSSSSSSSSSIAPTAKNLLVRSTMRTLSEALL
jgi:hypothetical protein